ncbi:hypothetical protein ACHQM5_002924 [Ranunculus cassubicifolius]
MGKSRDEKKKKNGAVSMDISTNTEENILIQAMDTTEGPSSDAIHGVIDKKIKKGIPMKRQKSARKMKAIKKAISKSEKLEERSKKHGIKVSRIQSAKLLYD